MSQAARTEKLDDNVNFKCFSDEVAEWNKYLVRRGHSLSQAIRDILNREVELKKLEKKE